MGKTTGYFVNGAARHKFIGGIGGSKELVDIKQLYQRLNVLLQRQNVTKKVEMVKVESNDLAQYWETAEIVTRDIHKEWKEHQNWWTVEELCIKFKSLEKESAPKNTTQNEEIPVVRKEQNKKGQDNEIPLQSQEKDENDNHKENNNGKNTEDGHQENTSQMHDLSFSQNELILVQEKCGCGHAMGSHNQPMNWKICPNCSRTFASECIFAETSGWWKCELCFKTTQKLEVMTSEHHEMKLKTGEKLEEINENVINIMAFVKELKKPTIAQEDTKTIIKANIELKSKISKLESQVKSGETLLKASEIQNMELTARVKALESKNRDMDKDKYIRHINTLKRKLNILEEELRDERSKIHSKNPTSINTHLLEEREMYQKESSGIKASVRVQSNLEKKGMDTSDQEREQTLIKVRIDNEENFESDKEYSPERRYNRTVTEERYSEHNYNRKSLSNDRQQTPEYANSSPIPIKRKESDNSSQSSAPAYKIRKQDSRERNLKKRNNKTTSGNEHLEKLKKNPKWTLISDSLLKGITQDKGLNVTSFLHNWEIRIKRGAKIEDIQRLLENTRGEKRLEGSELLVICAGSNDMDNIKTRERDIDEQISNIGHSLRELIRSNKDRTQRMMIIIPPPRVDVPEKISLKIEACYRKICSEEEVDVSSFLKANQTRQEFLQSIHSDGIHPGINETIFLISKLAKRTATDVDIQESDKDFDLQKIFPNQCWVCGGNHKTHADHTKTITGCGKCGLYNHNEEVCISLVRMCSHCGKRGHGRFKCPWNKNRQS